MLPELLESQATGRIAAIYAGIRRFSGVPYVSSLQRYLATLPGVLEWTWEALRPAMASGVIPETGWRLAADVRLQPASPTVMSWDAADVAAIRNIAANFVRVSPVNLVFGSCLRRLLTATAPAGPGISGTWTPPICSHRCRGMWSPERCRQNSVRCLCGLLPRSVARRSSPRCIDRSRTGRPRWRGWRTNWRHGCTRRRPMRGGQRSRRPRGRQQRTSSARLPAPRGTAPDAETTRRILAAVDRYAETSPEMTMFGRIILDALPAG